MKKIIVVGHPQSGYEGVEELLLDCGMAEAKSSRREGFMPAQISETLIKVHGAVPVQHVRNVDQLTQIEVAPVWQGLALDLMLANMEQPLWGWADVQAVYLLDYWKSQDPQTVFVLVFDEPQSVFTRQTLELADPSPEEQQARINGWLAYNSALLHFHLRNPERSLLVHAEQVKTSAQSYLQQVSLHVDAQLRLPSEESQSLVDHENQDSGHGAIQVSNGATGKQKQGLDGMALAQWLARQLLEEYPQATELYEQLQAAASLPQRSQTQFGRQLIASGVQANLRHQAWSNFVAQQTAMQAYAQRVLQLGKELNEQAQQVQEHEWQIEQLNQAGAKAQQREQEKERLIAAKFTELEFSEQENQLLLQQLHKVQEELESRYLQTFELEKALKELHKVRVDLKAAQEKITALEAIGREKKMLQEQLQKLQHELASRKTQVQQLEKLLAEQATVKAELKAAQDKVTQLQSSEANLKKELQTDRAKAPVVELQRENELLLVQLHKVQAELERSYRENCQLKAGVAKFQNKLKKTHYGAAERVKQQLSYRLGATMIGNSRSLGGWLSMPFALNGEFKRFKKDQAARSNQKLPPIAQYFDAHEAERVKKHLSYRLGACMIANSKTFIGWTAMPWALLVEIKSFRKERH